MIDLVLATDMKQHFALLSQFTTVHSSAGAEAKRAPQPLPAAGSGAAGAPPSRPSMAGRGGLTAGLLYGKNAAVGPRKHSTTAGGVSGDGSASGGGLLDLSSGSGSGLTKTLSGRKLSVLGQRRSGATWRESGDAASMDLPLSPVTHDAIPSAPERSACSTTVLELQTARRLKTDAHVPIAASGASGGTLPVLRTSAPVAGGEVGVGGMGQVGSRSSVISRIGTDSAASPGAGQSPTCLSAHNSLGGVGQFFSQPPPPDMAIAMQPMDDNERLLSLQVRLRLLSHVWYL
jgi:hypothetical protein